MVVLPARPRVKSRKPLKPAEGTVKVLRPVGEVNDRSGEIAINGKPALLEVLANGYRLHGWDAKRGEVTCYDLPADLSSCDCPDATYRGEREGGCKHRRALSALLAAGRIPEVRVNCVPPNGMDDDCPF